MSEAADSRQILRVALVQMRAGRTVAANLDRAEAMIRDAASRGARYIQTPENTDIMELDRAALMAELTNAAARSAVQRFGNLARTLGVWLHIGSIKVALDEPGEGRPTLANRAHLFAPDGTLAATYDKIHMFDVDLPGGERYRESAQFAPGDRAVVCDMGFATLGLSICYDVRFPGLYRTLAKGGAGMLTCPAAFTEQTGRAHWHILLRARAIENGSFMLAAAQGGRHENGRSTYGHSLVIDPWGQVLAELGTEPGVLLAECDLSRIGAARAAVPSLLHDRAFTFAQDLAQPVLTS